MACLTENSFAIFLILCYNSENEKKEVDKTCLSKKNAGHPVSSFSNSVYHFYSSRYRNVFEIFIHGSSFFKHFSLR